MHALLTLQSSGGDSTSMLVSLHIVDILWKSVVKREYWAFSSVNDDFYSYGMWTNVCITVSLLLPKVVMPCSWGVKAGMVSVWVAGKTVWSNCYTRAISERFRGKGLIIKCYINSAVYFTLLCACSLNILQCFRLAWYWQWIVNNLTAGFICLHGV